MVSDWNHDWASPIPMPIRIPISIPIPIPISISISIPIPILIPIPIASRPPREARRPRGDRYWDHGIRASRGARAHGIGANPKTNPYSIPNPNPNPYSILNSNPNPYPYRLSAAARSAAAERRQMLKNLGLFKRNPYDLRYFNIFA